MQKISIIKVFQIATQSAGVAEQNFSLQQTIEIKLQDDQVLSESFKDQHILKNFGSLIKKQRTWNNELQQFVGKVSGEIKIQQSKLEQQQQQQQFGQLNSEMLAYLRLQESLFLEKKREELGEQFGKVDLSDLEYIRKQEPILDLNQTKIKKSKSIINKQSSISLLKEEIHSEVIRSIQSIDEITKQIQQQLMTFSTSYTSIGEDTKYRLTHKNTRNFKTRFVFIFWRYTQRLISRILSYYLIVGGISFYENKQRIQQQQQLSSSSSTSIFRNQFKELPPIKGSNAYFKNKYKEQRSICFNVSTPYLFTTYTLNEFNRKTQQIVQGLNYFDLEDEKCMKLRRKCLDKTKCNQLQCAFTIYFYYMSKIISQCLMNQKPYYKQGGIQASLYDFGMYGECVGYTTRYEFQKRGTIHSHNLLFFKKTSSGCIDPKLLEYWSAIFSLWNYQKRNPFDEQFVQKYHLVHECTSDCLKANKESECKFGYPWQLNQQSYWSSQYKNLILPRIQNERESWIFLHDRDVVKFFRSSCVIETCGDDKIIEYITKYIHKPALGFEEEDSEENDLVVVGNNKQEKQCGNVSDSCDSSIGGDDDVPDSLNCNNNNNNGNTQITSLQQQQQQQYQQKEEEEEDADQQQQQINSAKQTLKRQANELMEKVLSKKVTSLSEAFSDLLNFPLFSTSFNCIKVSQVCLKDQFNVSEKQLRNCYDADNPDQDLKTYLKSSIWIKYLSRPEQLEELSLSQYLENFIWQGGKQKFKQKMSSEAQRAAAAARKANISECKKNKIFFLIDQNGQVLKRRERKEYKSILNLSQLYYLEELDYEPNLYFLAMLQLFWPHRQNSWLQNTQDNHEGFKRFYYKLYYHQQDLSPEGLQQQQQQSQSQLSEEKVITSKIQEEFEITLTSFRDKVNNYKQLTYAQQRFLKQIKFKAKGTGRKIEKGSEDQKQKQQQLQQEKQIKQRKKFFSYHKLLRCKNSIFKIKGQLQQQQEQEEVDFQFKEEILSILNYLRPDVLINSEEKERIENVENLLVNYLSSSQCSITKSGNKTQISYSANIILEELASLMQQQNFLKLYQLVCSEKKNKQSQRSDTKKEEEESEQQQYKEKNNMIRKYEQSTLQSTIKIAQSDVTYFDNFNEEAIYFPEFFKTTLTKSELNNYILRRPKMKNSLFHSEFQCSNFLNKVFNEDCNQQQKLSIIVLLQYLFQSQCLGQEENHEEDAIYEGCLIHGGGGVGKSFIIQFLISLFEEVNLLCYVLCPTQVAVQNLSKRLGGGTKQGEQNQNTTSDSKIMTIHSFLQLSLRQNENTSYDHFLSFLRSINKEHLFKKSSYSSTTSSSTSTSYLFPELAFYNCMNKVESFTLKLKGIHCIVLDEISMISPKMLDLLDIYLQVSLGCNLSFGGLQVYAFGDGFQLQPVSNPPSQYFQSHVFQNMYFSTYLELTDSIRQANDKEFYENILQPIRLGAFQDHPQFRNSLRQLRQRHCDPNINNQTQFNLAGGLQQEIQRLQINNDITFLYLDNESATKENQLRAEQHITQQQLQQSQNQYFVQQSRETFREFINSPARLSFAIKNTKQDKLLMNLSSSYELISSYFEKLNEEVNNSNAHTTKNNISHALHFRLLPLSIRNYLMKNLLPIVFKITNSNKNNNQKNKQTFYPSHLKLFKNAQIIFRKNLKKEVRFINGQGAIIKDIHFEIDKISNEVMVENSNKKEKLIDQYLSKNIIRKINQASYFRVEFKREFIEEIRKELQENDMNQVHCLKNEDILESEKQNFVECGIQPRIAELKVEIQGYEDEGFRYLKDIENYYKKQTIMIPSNDIIGIAKQALKLIQQIQEKISIVRDESQLINCLQSMIKEDPNMLSLLGLAILENSIDSHFLKRSEYHLMELIKILPIEQTMMEVSQLPINLGYARTIHTSQGATFNNICLSLNENYASKSGLLYTALSRVKKLQNLYLQGDFSEDLFKNTMISQEQKMFYELNFIKVDELINSKLFQSMLNKSLSEVLQLIPKLHQEIRQKILRSLKKTRKTTTNSQQQQGGGGVNECVIKQ